MSLSPRVSIRRQPTHPAPITGLVGGLSVRMYRAICSCSQYLRPWSIISFRIPLKFKVFLDLLPISSPPLLFLSSCTLLMFFSFYLTYHCLMYFVFICLNLFLIFLSASHWNTGSKRASTSSLFGCILYVRSKNTASHPGVLNKHFLNGRNV